MKKILFITLSNIGDIILTLPALDVLMQKFPAAKITLMVGPNGKEIFENNPDIDKIIVFDKHCPLREKIRLFNYFKKEQFDAVIDFRNSFFGALLPARYRISPFLVVPQKVIHMKDRNLYRLGAGIKDNRVLQPAGKKSLWISIKDREYIETLLKENNVAENDRIVIIAAGARSHIKRWDKDKFAQLCQMLSRNDNVRIILIGDKTDKENADYIMEKSGCKMILNFCGKTTIPQSAELLKRSALLICHDSAVMHMGGYIGVKTLAIFGPTNEVRYGPCAEISATVKKDIFCRPCLKAQCRFSNLKCMTLIRAEDVFRKAQDILGAPPESAGPRLWRGGQSHFSFGGAGNSISLTQFRRILIIRTDRIGDVLLSTPVIKALRESYPNAYIAVMVSPYAKEIVEGNPYLDEVIIYDKDVKHKTAVKTIAFSRFIRKMKFDLALVLHPTNRAHLVAFLSGIKRRIGYNRKLGFLLTDKIEHTKQFGAKHESEYALDTVRYLGIETKEAKPFMPVNLEEQNRTNEFLKTEGISSSDKLLGIHPAASCISKIWPAERFARAADKLVEKYGFKVLIFSGPADIKIAQKVSSLMRHKNIELGGKTSISRLTVLLKRCDIFISNDSGPVHIASAVGTPVISIFGRNQRGLSPERWGPLGSKNKILHKEIGCAECLAHNCVKDFACLKALAVDDVLAAADAIIE